MQSTKKAQIVKGFTYDLPKSKYYETINADMILRTKIFRFLERMRKAQNIIDKMQKVENTLQKLVGVAL